MITSLFVVVIGFAIVVVTIVVVVVVVSPLIIIIIVIIIVTIRVVGAVGVVVVVIVITITIAVGLYVHSIAFPRRFSLSTSCNYIIVFPSSSNFMNIRTKIFLGGAGNSNIIFSTNTSVYDFFHILIFFIHLV